ncbi:sensor histidine kinase [Burkholderia ambifaria]|uniref:ATP-binding protein n=1 Tax=Burkholderia ambifaria TaxID=152480 RepID=UPI001B9722BC|nr:sensor histidine kinase [Burkholderia ambifaria]MBR8335455.1 sensor histidine kinase [Burkholderia ambifaria]
MTSSAISQADLQKQIVQLLGRDKIDYGKILVLTEQLATFDVDNARFTTDAGLIARLGRELVARQETALSELVKNAYDADAVNVSLIFENETSIGGTLTVTDDGNGMSRRELIDGFMRLASTEKLRAEISPRFERLRAGRKGIGRFATQRLGAALTIITQTADTAHALKISIDWNNFTPGSSLTSIANRITTVPKERSHGTTLVISNLTDEWSEAQISRSFRYIRELLEPFPILEPLSGQGPRGDPGFHPSFSRRDSNGQLAEIASEARMVSTHSAATIRAIVDSEGKVSMRLQSDRLDFDEIIPLNSEENDFCEKYRALRNITLTAYYFVYVKEFIPPHESAGIQRLAREQGGFRLYRNGFRVLPYGEKNNDWLGLDDESRKRGILGGIANINWFGAVEIDDKDHSQFSEVSSREGLDKNLAYDELVDFGRSVAIATALKIAHLRGRKAKAGGRSSRGQESNSHVPEGPSANELRQFADRLETELTDRSANIDDIFDNNTDQNDSIEDSRPLPLPTANLGAEAVKKFRAAADFTESLLAEREMLRVLSSLGLLIGLFIHEARTKLVAARAGVEVIASALPETHQVSASLQTTKDNVALLQDYLSYFDEAISSNVSRTVGPQNISDLIYEFIGQFEHVAEHYGITFECDIDEDVISGPMHKSEWASILGNLFTNSVKAIRRAKRGDGGRIFISAKIDDEKILVNFCDNGDGIPPENREHIFDAFFTTTNNALDDDLTGMGLGLKIVHDIITSRNGDIYVDNPPPNYQTSIQIELPAQEEE